MAATLHCIPWMWLSLRYWLGLSDRHRALRAKAKSVSAEALLMIIRFSGSIKTIFWRAHQGVATPDRCVVQIQPYNCITHGFHKHGGSEEQQRRMLSTHEMYDLSLFDFTKPPFHRQGGSVLTNASDYSRQHTASPAGAQDKHIYDDGHTPGNAAFGVVRHLPSRRRHIVGEAHSFGLRRGSVLVRPGVWPQR